MAKTLHIFLAVVCWLSNKPIKSIHLIFATEMQLIENYPKVTPANFVVFYMPGIFLEVGAKLFSQLFKKNAWPRSGERLLPPKCPNERGTNNLISNFYPSPKPPLPKKFYKNQWKGNNICFIDDPLPYRLCYFFIVSKILHYKSASCRLKCCVI